MPSVFIYEFLTAGGCFSLGAEPPAGSLLFEGAAMRDTLAADFSACDLIDEVHLLHDVRLLEPQIGKQRVHRVTSAAEKARVFQQVARKADRTVIIAPEFGGCLERMARGAMAAEAKLLSPDAKFVQLTADKGRTAECLRRANVPVPRGVVWRGRYVPKLEAVLFPAVLKPLDGAGSTHVRLIQEPDDFAVIDLTVEPAWRLERFQPGIAASVAYLSGLQHTLVLPGCSQRLSDDGTFKYLGGSTPLPPQLAERAARLAKRVSRALPKTIGYVGIDIVLGTADNGADDVVIEVNPRLTTSYLGLRQACEQNLAEAMWRLGEGEGPRLSFRAETIHFSPYSPSDAA